jgi:uncharacterized protein (DUF1778 family)
MFESQSSVELLCIYTQFVPHIGGTNEKRREAGVMAIQQRQTKSDRIYVRVSKTQRATLDRAAALLGKTQSQFISDAVEQAVDRAYRSIVAIELDRDAFMNLQTMTAKQRGISKSIASRFKRAPAALDRS